MDSQSANDIVERVRGLLRENSNEEMKAGSRRFFKKNEQALVYGVKTAAVRKIAKAVFAEIRGLSKSDIFALRGSFWKSGYIEEIGVACEWSYAVRKQYFQRTFRFLKNGSI
jgi:3-methyladenine DNA glycosylase AlkD